MSFLDQRLSTKVALGFRGGPEFLTQVVNFDSGREQRNGQWQYPKMRYSAGYLNFLNAERDEILAAFYTARGKLHVFRFKDHADWQAAGEVLAPQVGTTTAVQLVKTYAFGGMSTTRLIQAPVTAAVTLDGVAVAGTLDAATGLFTPDAAWAAGVTTWDGTFDVWVRFDNDHNAFGAEESPNAWSTSIELIEVRR